MGSPASLRDKAASYRRLSLQIDDAQAKEALTQAIGRLDEEADRAEAVEVAARRASGREIYASQNGDRWILVATASGTPRVVHLANDASGGARTESEIDTFLTTNGRHTPQHQGLLHLIARLAKES